MFKRSHCINSREFRDIYKTGKRKNTLFFRTSYVFSEDVKVAVVVPKKHIKKRVHRNREKRRIMHALYEIYTEQSFKGSLIFFLQKNTHALSFFELKQELLLLLKKTGL